MGLDKFGEPIFEQDADVVYFENVNGAGNEVDSRGSITGKYRF
jgi:hypothetical protein